MHVQTGVETLEGWNALFQFVPIHLLQQMCHNLCVTRHVASIQIFDIWYLRPELKRS